MFNHNYQQTEQVGLVTKVLLSMKNMAGQLTFAKLHLNIQMLKCCGRTLKELCMNTSAKLNEVKQRCKEECKEE